MIHLSRSATSARAMRSLTALRRESENVRRLNLDAINATCLRGFLLG